MSDMTSDMTSEEISEKKSDKKEAPSSDPTNEIQKVWTGEMVKSLRLRLGLTASSLAQRLSCDVEQIRHWELGGRIDDIHFSVLQKLFKIAESNSVAMGQRPMAEEYMKCNGLSQVSDEVLKEIVAEK